MAAVSKPHRPYLPGGLPATTSSILGREREIAELLGLLSEDGTRLLTLLGPGGAGKTRLALAVAESIESTNPDLVCYVPASEYTTADELLGGIASAMGLREEAEVALEQTVFSALQADSVLLLLDNVEQISGTAEIVGRLLQASPYLTVLATSRTPLKLRGERRFSVDPLSTVSREPEKLSPAVQLFVDRANETNPGFVLNHSNLETISAICRRLDGLPLAIELAAARTRALSPAALLARLSNQLTLLSSGAVDLPERHRTMQAAIAWSYDLLSDSTRKAMRQLAIIPSPFTLTLAASVCEARDGETLALIEDLLDSSLLRLERQDDDGPLFRMLQTIRDFGRECAALNNEIESTEVAIANEVVGRSDSLRTGLSGPDAVTWRARCTEEHATLLLALQVFVRNDDAASATRLAASLWRFWYGSGRFREGIDSISRAIELNGTVEPIDMANALNGLGAIHYALSNYEPAIAAWNAAAPIWRTLGDALGEAGTLNNLSLVARERGEYRTAIDLLQRAAEICLDLDDARRLATTQDNLGLVLTQIGEKERAAELHAKALASSRIAGDEAMIAAASHHLGSCFLEQGDFPAAQQHVETAVAIWRKTEDLIQLGYGLNTLANIAAKMDRHDLSAERLEEALRVWRERGYSRGVSLGLLNLGVDAERRGDFGVAITYYRESLDLRRIAADPIDLSYALNAFASVAHSTGDFERAARLMGSTEALLLRSGLPGNGEGAIAELRHALGDERFEKYWNIGQQLSIDDAITETEFVSATPHEQRIVALAALPATVRHAAHVDHGLTTRELDVLRLVAAGKTNAEIGEVLFISPFTAKTHVANLLGKLAVENRAAASTWAAQHAIV